MTINQTNSVDTHKNDITFINAFKLVKKDVTKLGGASIISIFCQCLRSDVDDFMTSILTVGNKLN